ncbi:MAG TPA: hypothetical protein VN256_12965 [Pyrinomonadaceae bacterium]|nr:hypothetical protein [Pyrinomonadaceae bacterium]
MMSELRKYNFTDELGHPLENCVEFQALLTQVRNDVKAACPSIPPAPKGHFHEEENVFGGVRALDIFIDGDGEADVTITTRDDTLSFYLTTNGIARLRDWLNGQHTTPKDAEGASLDKTG